MKQLVKYIFSTIICVFIGLYAHSQSISVNAPKVVAVGEYVQISYTINSEVRGGLEVSRVNALEPIGQSISMRNINGNISYSETHQYRALSKGIYKIPVATVKINGKIITSKSQDIEIVEGNSRRNSQANSQNQAYPQAKTSQSGGKDAFVDVIVNKQNAYVGEPIYVSLKLYTTKNFSINDFKFPTFEGFYKNVLEQPKELKYTKEKVQGKEYYAVVFQKLVIYPQKSGLLKITPFTLDCNIETPVQNGWFGFFNQTERRTLQSNIVTVKAISLPTGNSSDFTGAVGDFKLATSISAKTIPANEAITYKITLSGIGNLALIKNPKIVFPDNFEVFEPKVSNSYTPTSQGDKGSKTFEYTIIPRHAGNFTIPSIQLQYFNPQTKKYISLSSEAYSIIVTKSNKQFSSSNFNANTSKEEVKYKGNDILYLKTSNLELHNTPQWTWFPLWYYICFALTFIIGVSTLFVIRKRALFYAQTEKVKYKFANTESKKRLKKAKECMLSNNNSEFYNELSKAVWGYISDKCMLPISELRIDSIRQYLFQKQISKTNIEELIFILTQCDYARYAPVSESQREELLQRTEDIIMNLEQELKHK